MDEWVGNGLDGGMGRWVEGCFGGWVYGWMDGYMGGWVGGCFSVWMIYRPIWNKSLKGGDNGMSRDAWLDGNHWR